MRYYKLIDGSSFSSGLPLLNRPKAAIVAAYTVCVVCMLAGNAAEAQALPIGFLGMPATWTAPRSVPSGNQLQADANGSGFVAHEEQAGGIRPPVNSGAKLLPFFERTGTDAFKVFHHDQACVYGLSKGHQSLASDMEKVLRYGSLMARQPAKQATGRSRANASDLSTSASNTRSAMVEDTGANIQSFVRVDVNSSKEVLDPAVNAHNGSLVFQLGNLNDDGEYQVPLTTHKFQLGVRPFAFRQRAALKASWGSPNGQPNFGDGEVSIPNNRHIEFLEHRQSPTFVGSGGAISAYYMPEKRTSDLTRELKLLSNCCVELSMKLSRGFGLSSIVNNLGKPISGLAIGERNLQQLGVVGSELQFVSPCGFHTNVYIGKAYEKLEQFLERSTRIPPLG
jgi:hypothetical protein